MIAYQQQLKRWSDSLSAGDGEKVLADLTADCHRGDVERFLENSVGERYRLLSEELDLVALAFEDFDDRIEAYLRQVPRQTYQLQEREQQRFLRWLKRQPLTDQQADYITYQECEYACYDLARDRRTAYLEFHNAEQQWRRHGHKEMPIDSGTALVNPVCVRARLAVAAAADGGLSGDVLFLAVDHQVRSLWLTSEQELVVQCSLKLSSAAQPRVGRFAWQGHQQTAIVAELQEAGLFVLECF